MALQMHIQSIIFFNVVLELSQFFSYHLVSFSQQGPANHFGCHNNPLAPCFHSNEYWISEKLLLADISIGREEVAVVHPYMKGEKIHPHRCFKDGRSVFSSSHSAKVKLKRPRYGSLGAKICHSIDQVLESNSVLYIQNTIDHSRSKFKI